MPLYTVRTNLTCQTDHLHRGDFTASMSHHFTWPDDLSAMADYPTLVDHYVDSTIGDRWTCGRGSTAHEMILYRRSIENARSFTRLGSTAFQLDDWTSFELDLPGSEGAISSTITEAPIYRHNRGAILVLEVAADTTVTKRTYIGPCSEIAFQGYYESLFPTPVTTWFAHPLLFDTPATPADSVDVWRERMATSAVDHVVNLASDFEHGGERVLVAWSRGIVSPAAIARASLTRAELRSRTVNGGFTNWYAAGDDF